jgi:hypothetical protein
MLNIILVILMFLCGFGGYAIPATQPAGFRYGVGLLGAVLFILFCLINLGIIHPGTL